VGLGSPGSGVDGLRRSAREALRALRIGSSLPWAQRVYAYEDVAVLDLVGIDSSGAREFMRSVLGPLAVPGASRTYLETLRQLSASGYRIKPAAAALSVHPHTLSYRVKQIRRRLGLDLDDPEVRLRVHLALLILAAQDARTARRSGGEIDGASRGS
jgi:DNA-binding PucR family transcriptional regulator